MKITAEEFFRKLGIVGKQREHIENNPASDITCECGESHPILEMYQCLYCREWYCQSCAEEHFGKTVAQWREEHPNPF